MKIYVFLLLLLWGCKKEDSVTPTPTPPTPQPICKTCYESGYVKLPTHTIVPYSMNMGVFCGGDLNGKAGVFDTIKIKYNTTLKKNDTTWYHTQIVCQ